MERELQPRLDVPDNSTLYEEIGGLRRLITDRLAATNRAIVSGRVADGVREATPALADLPSMFVTASEGDNFGATRQNFSSGLGDLFGNDDDNFDDGEVDLVVRKDTSTTSAQNFLHSMMSLQQ